MIINLESELIERVNKKIGDKNPFLKAAVRWTGDKQKKKIDLNDMLPDELDVLEKELLAKSDAHSKRVAGQIKLFRNLTSAKGTTKVKKLSHLPDALKALLAPTPNRWLFSEESDGSTLPYFVEKIMYVPTDRTGNWTDPQHVNIHLIGYQQGEQVTRRVRIDDHELDYDLQTILHKHELYIETTEAVAEFKALVNTAKLWLNQTGAQFIATGSGESADDSGYSWRSTDTVQMVRDGRPTKVVMDNDASAEDSGSSTRSRSSSKTSSDMVEAKYWRGAEDRTKLKQSEDDDDHEGAPDDGMVQLPLHPYVRVFDLDQHQYVDIHVQHLQPYEYDKTLIRKLVLAEEKKTLINLLVRGSNENIEDIVSGKMAGVIVLATGEPGVGKTLTAEVFSEEIERPLYVVQCSQLGLKIETIEQNLTKVLSRAQRWGAILLIDEADVYIHERGSDMHQNAIVGVFLRVLEYYRGVLFMTSNRGDIVDDAIMSRATAWIRYERPDAEQQAAIWEILAEQFRINLKDKTKTIKRMATAYPKISGREVRNVLKLARLAHGDEPVTDKELLYLAEYQNLVNAKADEYQFEVATK